MTEPKVIAVVGATGAQGGGLCEAILEDRSGGYACRALTRDPEKPKAKALAERGAQVVSANIDDPAGLVAAFEGAHGAFCVTNFWEHFSPEREIAQARNMAEAARKAGVKHVIWSTLEDTRKLMKEDDRRMPILQGKYRVPHFDAKGEADAFFSGVPTTFLVASMYWDNLAGPLFPQKGDDGVYRLALPVGKVKLAGVAAEDIGRLAYAIFKRGSECVGQYIGAAGEQLTAEEMAAQMTAILGLGTIRYEEMTPDAYRALGFPGADEFGNMFQVYRDFEAEINRVRDPEVTRRLHPAALTFEQFLKKYRDRFPRA